MAAFFYWLLNMSITSAFTGLVVMLIRKIRIIPRRFILVLWVIPFLRMALPVGLMSRYSLLSVVSGFLFKTIPLKSDWIRLGISNSILAADGYFPLIFKKDLIYHIFYFAAWVWLAVVAVLFCLLIAVHRKSSRMVMNAVPYMDDTYISDQIDTPLVYGVFHPKILIPAFYKGEQMEYILVHEKTHINNRDNLWRMIALIIAVIHWFNPFSWIFLVSFLADIELACDESVLKRLGTDKKKVYASSLLDFAEKKTVFTSSYTGAKLYQRIERILFYKKMKWYAACCFVGFIAVLFIALLTNPYK